MLLKDMTRQFSYFAMHTRMINLVKERWMKLTIQMYEIRRVLGSNEYWNEEVKYWTFCKAIQRSVALSLGTYHLSMFNLFQVQHS